MRLTVTTMARGLLQMCPLWMLMVNLCESLRCYQCENEKSNFMCISEANLVECGPGLDTCQTMVAYHDVSEKLSIIKTCTKNTSCELQVNATRLSRPCDRALDSWVCTTCCYDDECNIDTAAARFQYGAQVKILVAALLVVLAFTWTAVDGT